MQTCTDAHARRVLLCLGGGYDVTEATPMSTNTLLLIIVLVLLFGGGGFYFRR